MSTACASFFKVKTRFQPEIIMFVLLTFAFLHASPRDKSNYSSFSETQAWHSITFTEIVSVMNFDIKDYGMILDATLLGPAYAQTWHGVQLMPIKGRIN